MNQDFNDDVQPEFNPVFVASHHDEILAFMQANPNIEKNMHVAVYEYCNERKFIGYGIILDCWWSDHWEQWMASVIMTDGHFEPSVMACNLERIAFDGSTQFAILKSRTINGGKNG